jgi:hypothetical protein
MREVQDLSHDRPEQQQQQIHKGDVSFYVKNIDLISLRQKYNYKENEGKNDRNRNKLLLDALKLVGIGRLHRIQKYLGIFKLGLARGQGKRSVL